jgi:Icc-related predicted phosphoesterase
MPRPFAPITALVVALAACGVGPTTGGIQELPDNPLATGPYVMLGGPNRAYVAFKAGADSAPKVRWTAETGESGVVAAKRRLDMFYAQLDDLPRGPEINYVVTLADGQSERGSFRVGTGPGEDRFRFVAFGDTRTGHSVHRAVIEAVSREQVDFVVHTGDMVERGGKQDQWNLFFQIERPLLRKAPILPAIGNHDASGRFYYERYFLLDLWTGGRRYFATDWGNLRLVAIDGGVECRKGCEQYSFFREALAKGAEAGKLMVVFLHYPPYSSGNHGSHLGVREPIAELAREYGVELVIAGHDHNYERTVEIDGTTYVVSGSAGAPIRPVKPQPFTAHARTEPHYVLIDVDREQMGLRAINLRGETFDSHVIKPNSPRQFEARSAPDR